MKIVLQVDITCEKCKTCVLGLASEVQGINSLTFDKEKSTLTVVGDVDVVVVVEKLRKKKHPAKVISVTDEKKEAEEKKKKEEEEKKKKEAEEKKKKEEEEKKKCAQLCRPSCQPCPPCQPCPKLFPQPCQPYYIPVDDQPGPCTIV